MRGQISGVIRELRAHVSSAGSKASFKMKAIILATAAIVFTFALATILFGATYVERRVRALIYLFATVLFSTVVVCLLTPGNLMFLPQGFEGGPWWFDAIMVVFFCGAGFLGGVLQLYNLADRGFSLRILIDVDERGGAGCTADILFDGYSQGRGMRWMYGKRIDDIIRNKFVLMRDETLVLTSKGSRLAMIYCWLRRFLNADA